MTNYMKKLLLITMLAACSMTSKIQAQSASQTTFVTGADVSWCSEMEADGKLFYNANGEQTELMALMKQIGMNVIRLRVWVNPENVYGNWSNKADVLAKARRVKAQGLKLMIDFHYSDFFADPGRQTKPAAWQNMTLDQLKQAVADHTTDVLQALKDEGIEPEWVQVGNETRVGMVWNEGKIDWSKTGSSVWSGYVALSNAGYDAVKQVLPQAQVIVHIDKGHEDNVWFFNQFKQYGGKFDVIGLSHYPTTSWASENTQVASRIATLVNTFSVPVMIVETGYYQSNETLAEQVMTDLFDKTKGLNNFIGILYWEPQLYSWWKPAYYTTLGWNAYDRGAFTSQGRPGKALNPFANHAESVTPLKLQANELPQYFTIDGYATTPSTKGLVIVKEAHRTYKVVR